VVGVFLLSSVLRTALYYCLVALSDACVVWQC